MTSILPLVSLVRALGGKRAAPARARKLSAYDLTVVPFINEILGWILMIESHFVARRVRMPFGASLVAVALKLKADERLVGN